MFSELYEKFLSRIQDKTDIKYVDLFFGQCDGEMNEEDPFPFPAAFIEFMTSSFDSTGNGVQKSAFIFRIHVMDIVMTESNSLTTEGVRTASHSHLKNVDDVSRAFNGFNSGTDTDVFFSSCTRTSIEPYNPNGSMIIHVIEFLTNITDKTMAKTYVPKATTASVTVNNTAND